MKLLSILFSFRNEEKILSELINRTTSVLKKISNWNYELIFVNDASVAAFWNGILHQATEHRVIPFLFDLYWVFKPLDLRRKSGWNPVRNHQMVLGGNQFSGDGRYIE